MDSLGPSLRIALLIEKYLKDNLTPEESIELNNWLSGSHENKALFTKLTNENYLQGELQFFEQLSTEDGRQKVAKQTWQGSKTVSINRKRWWYAAAAAVLIAGSFTVYQLSTKQNIKRETAETAPIKQDVSPGGNKAVLTLSDGSTIILDSAANGNLANQGNVKVIKLDGKLTYSGKEKGTGETSYNTITTPRGGQYQLVLSDGSTVWLNAASSLKYPVTFNGNERKVEVTGEAYFEVAKNTSMPFKVMIPEKGEVEVLGTHFNINAYSDEEGVRTTLLEGSVDVSAANGKSVRLLPGQQAKIDNSISIQSNVDTDEIIAWKTGWFNFDHTDISSIMRQVSRWYDVDVVFQGQPGKKTFSGIVSRDNKISEVLKIMEKAGVVFRIEGKQITVLSN
jgi:ferric-dicitrate binding protein FerR (iron transport regulator)